MHNIKGVNKIKCGKSNDDQINGRNKTEDFFMILMQLFIQQNQHFYLRQLPYFAYSWWHYDNSGWEDSPNVLKAYHVDG